MGSLFWLREHRRYGCGSLASREQHGRQCSQAGAAGESSGHRIGGCFAGCGSTDGPRATSAERARRALLLVTQVMGVSAAAVREARADCVKILRDAGADMTLADDEDGNTALMAAVDNGDNDWVKMLLDAGADADQFSDHHGCTALMLAAEHGSADCVKTLLAAGADADKAGDYDGWTALMFAAEHGSADCVKTLLAAGAETDKTTPRDSWTALMSAAENGRTDCVKTLLAAGAETDKTTRDGWTALMFAARKGHTDCVKTLLDAGADFTITTKTGRTALKIAETTAVTNADEVVALLRAAQPPLPYDDSNDDWADECHSEYDSDDSNAENHPDNDFPEEQDSDWDDDIFGGMGMRIEGATHGGSGRGGVDHGVGGDDSEYDVDEYVEESDSEDDVDGHNDGND